MNNFVSATVRRQNINVLVISLATGLLVLCGLAVSWRYLYNAWSGPFAVDKETLLALADPDSRAEYYVTVTGDDHADTGYYYETTSNGNTRIDYYYHALLLDDKLLIVKSRDSEITDEVVGALEKVPSDVQREVIAELEEEVPSTQGAFLPMLLDATNFYTNGYIGLAAAAIVGLLAMGGVGLAGYRLANPNAHPALKDLGRYGQLETVTGEIDLEMAAPHDQVGKKFHLTQRWLVSTLNGLQAVPYRDVMWCYKQVTQHRTNGIPTGKTYAAQLYDRHGKLFTLTGKEAEINDLLQKLAQKAPGVITGYSDELVKLWKNERARFIAAVDERRRNPPPQAQ